MGIRGFPFFFRVPGRVLLVFVKCFAFWDHFGSGPAFPATHFGRMLCVLRSLRLSRRAFWLNAQRSALISIPDRFCPDPGLWNVPRSALISGFPAPILVECTAIGVHFDFGSLLSGPWFVECSTFCAHFGFPGAHFG